jgi:uncharacterized protein YdeI (YjbR/CyaY-like superfamily)
MRFRTYVEPAEPMRGLEVPPVVEPADFARALDADPVARAAYDRLASGRKREHVRAIERAKRPETRRRIEQAVAMLGDRESAGGRAARAKP